MNPGDLKAAAETLADVLSPIMVGEHFPERGEVRQPDGRPTRALIQHAIRLCEQVRDGELEGMGAYFAIGQAAGIGFSSRLLTLGEIEVIIGPILA